MTAAARKHLLIGLSVRLLLAFLLPLLLDDGLLLNGVRYTDVDYDVFTDAAHHIAQGRSPYDRHTYRYTPFLAGLLALPSRYCRHDDDDDGGCGAMLSTMTSRKYFGKILFCIADALCGYAIVLSRRRQRRDATNTVGDDPTLFDPDLVDALWWLYNPLPINICTRGSAESLVVLLPVLAAVSLAQNGNSIVAPATHTKWSVAARSCMAGVFHGMGIHAKLYPLIYTVSFMAYLSHQEQSLSSARQISSNERSSSNSSSSSVDDGGTWSNSLSDQMQYVENCMCCFNGPSEKSNATFPWRHPVKICVLGMLWVERLFLTVSSVLFLVSTLITTAGLTYAAVQLYGHDALQEGLLYHFQRMDHRHNYSMYWYWIYLSRGRVAAAAAMSTTSTTSTMSTSLMYMNHIPTIPQICILGFTSLGIAPYDLPMALFLQTFVFVSFNKVMTAQYFTWYLCLLPLCSDRIEWKSKRAIYSLVFLGAAVAVWLVSAFTLEMLGWKTHRQVWMASVFFFAANVNLLVAMVEGYRAKKAVVTGGCYSEPGRGWSKLKVS